MYPLNSNVTRNEYQDTQTTKTSNQCSENKNKEFVNTAVEGVTNYRSVSQKKNNKNKGGMSLKRSFSATDLFSPIYLIKKQDNSITLAPNRPSLSNLLPVTSSRNNTDKPRPPTPRPPMDQDQKV
jgi:hypothetical protein